MRDPGILVLIPARDEEESIGPTLRSIFRQEHPADRVVVVADNCSDGTAEIALSLGAEVFVPRDNRQFKAGALNQALARYLTQMPDTDTVMVMDADTELFPDFFKNALRQLGEGVGAIGAVYFGRRGKGGLLGLLQRMEYRRYARELARRRGRAICLSGTATLFRVEALRRVWSGRASGELPRLGSYYSETHSSEDFELTLALRTLGYACLNPDDCRVVTDTMPSLPKLWAQRVRWQRGTFEGLHAYGLNRITLPYYLRIAFTLTGLPTFFAWMTALVLTLHAGGTVEWSLFWQAVTLLFILERAWSARGEGRLAVLAAIPLVFDMVYDYLRQIVYIKALWDVGTRAPREWKRT